MAKKSKKADNAKLAKGAAKIKKAQKEATKKAEPKAIERVEIPEVTRPQAEIIRERVTVLPGHIGVQIDDATPIQESLVILDWATQLSDHVGFIIGDVLNFGNTKWGDKYTQALNQTGRALSTLKGYAETARKIPYENRVASLTFSHHREMVRLDDAKIADVLKEVGAQAEEAQKRGERGPTTKEVRFKVQKLTPRRRKPKKATSGKGKTKEKVVEIPYEPTAEEASIIDLAEEKLDEAEDAIKPAFKIVARLENKEKKRWLAKLQPFVIFHNNLDKVTGY